MKSGYIIPICLTAVLLMFAACTKEKIYPVEPDIEFVSFTKIQNSLGNDETGILKLSFTDGDGDIGLSDADKEPPFDSLSMYYYNFFITYFEKQHGVFVAVDIAGTNNSRIPIISPDGKERSVKGEIEMRLFLINPLSTFDTIRYECFIVDRALHHSDTITTPEIVLKKH
jgi:hypothetical protein